MTGNVNTKSFNYQLLTHSLIRTLTIMQILLVLKVSITSCPSSAFRIKIAKLTTLTEPDFRFSIGGKKK